MKVTVPFLVNAPVFEADVPDAMDPSPNLMGVVALAGAPRHLTFVPASRLADPATNDGLAYVADLTQDAWTISVFERRDPPAILYAYWRLDGGYLVTFMDEPSPGRAGLRQVVQNLRVSEANALPRVTLAGLLTQGDQREPAQRQEVAFVPRRVGGSVWAVRFTLEPVNTRQSRGLDTWGDVSNATVTTTLGVTVGVEGPSSSSSVLQDLADEIAGSLVAAG